METLNRLLSAAGLVICLFIFSGAPVLADNCNPNNLTDCDVAPGNINGTAAAVGLLAGLGLLNEARRGRNGNGGSTPQNGDRTFLDDLR